MGAPSSITAATARFFQTFYQHSGRRRGRAARQRPSRTRISATFSVSIGSGSSQQRPDEFPVSASGCPALPRRAQAANTASSAVLAPRCWGGKANAGRQQRREDGVVMLTGSTRFSSPASPVGYRHRMASPSASGAARFPVPVKRCDSNVLSGNT